MQPITDVTKVKKRGGARKGSGRKATGKKYFSYYLDPNIGDKVSKQENPSEFVEQAIKAKLWSLKAGIPDDVKIKLHETATEFVKRAKNQK